MRISIGLLFIVFALCMELSTGGFGAYGYGGGYGGSRRSYGGGRRTGRTYSDIARVINPNPYAFVGRSPYPGQPFWPQG
ncbi:uncharacterized protein LOC119686235 [Teleopsis dalmanni]|uniref:uncharacterized protein LOC119686144 n=1 Tax=Teleopsis dalmanni TaxID=139649 RepID=UPI0018CE8934|nr:uncharacterized protein LOC119686144 [Teleopsis dalmanni]XP_037956689.1 uncharacterized protein LOC119686235 [Teleopsis dalmanni]